MDVFNLLSYINKISLFAFFITTVVVAYQIYILKKEKTKEQTLSIPDFKENNNFSVAANFTNLPSSLTKKKLKAVNYSKLIFLIISLLTVIIVIFVVSLINKNRTSPDQALVTPPAVVTQTPIRKSVSPTPEVILSLSPTMEASPSPMVEASAEASPTGMLVLTSTSPTLVPTEIILAKAPSLTPMVSLTNGPTQGALTVLPETGNIQKGLLIIGVAISTIFFSFWF